jgi:two-component system, response regulator RegA
MDKAMRPTHDAGAPVPASPLDGATDGVVPDRATELTDPLLLVEGSPGARGCLQRVLTAAGFTVLGVPGMRQAEAAAAETAFGYAVINLRLNDGHGLPLVSKLRAIRPSMRIVVVTEVDSFASVILALRAGADDYIARPLGDAELVDALLDRAPGLPPVPETPLGLSRTCWEHVMRVYEQCDRNVTHTAQRLGMHRRSLQRILSKRAPLPRAPKSGRAADW